MNESQLGFTFDVAKCIQCHGCEMACKMWRDTERGVSWRRVVNIWSGAYPGASCMSLSVSCLHCVRPACVEACPVGAISKREADGVVLVDRALCTGCRACLDACPFEVPQFGADGLMQKCDLCAGEASDALRRTPPCVGTCPTGALGLITIEATVKAAAETETAELYRKYKISL